MSEHPGISVVMPIRNEEEYLSAAVLGILQQNYPGPLELILSIGPSEDETWQVAQSLAAADERVRVIENPTGFTPAGLNLAIGAARYEVVVRVDGHGELCEGYLETAVRVLQETGAANVGGRMDAQGTSALQRAVAAAYNSRLGLGGGGFHLEDTPAGPADTVFLGVFRRSVLQEVGGFDESLHRGQDWELNYRLRQAGQLVYYTPELSVVYRPRASLGALAKQFFNTGRWRREIVRRHPETLSLRYLAPPVAVGGLSVGLVGGLAGLVSGCRIAQLALSIPIGYLGMVTVASLLAKRLDPAARAWLPVVLMVMHCCWGAGFLAGVSNRRLP